MRGSGCNCNTLALPHSHPATLTTSILGYNFLPSCYSRSQQQSLLISVELVLASLGVLGQALAAANDAHLAIVWYLSGTSLTKQSTYQHQQFRLSSCARRCLKLST